MVVDGEKVVGYGDTLTDRAGERAVQHDWCPKSYAQGFLLYKLYTYAAVLTP